MGHYFLDTQYDERMKEKLVELFSLGESVYKYKPVSSLI